MGFREGFFKKWCDDGRFVGKRKDLSESLMILVMVGSTVSKHSRRSDVGIIIIIIIIIITTKT